MCCCPSWIQIQMGRAESRCLSLVGWSRCSPWAVTAGWRSLAWLEETGQQQAECSEQISIQDRYQTAVGSLKQPVRVRSYRMLVRKVASPAILLHFNISELKKKKGKSTELYLTPREEWCSGKPPSMHWSNRFVDITDQWSSVMQNCFNYL